MISAPPANESLADWLTSLPDAERAAALRDWPDEDVARLPYLWECQARPNQLPPTGEWRTWLVLTGRGWGKTRTGAEWVRAQVERGACRRMALVAPTAADVRDVMVEGESGLLSVAPPDFRPLYEPSKRRLTWPNGAIATTYSADEPDRLRGPQHDGAWADELAAWRRPEAWDMLLFGLRLGGDPRVVVTTTPRPVRAIRELLWRDPVARVPNPTTVVTRGRSAENTANLAPAFLERIVKRFEGTRLGRQELEGELLEEVPGALWQRAQIEALRLPPDARLGALTRVVVAVDPAASSEEGSDETGIVVVARGSGGHGYVLADLSGRYTPDGWARRAVEAYRLYAADRIVAEANNGGAMVEHTLRTVAPGVAYTAVHASRGKVTRAEPVAALYEQGRVHHVGAFPDLEDQQCAFTPDLDRTVAGSPDRVDALVWGLTEALGDLMAGDVSAFGGAMPFVDRDRLTAAGSYGGPTTTGPRAPSELLTRLREQRRARNRAAFEAAERAALGAPDRGGEGA